MNIVSLLENALNTWNQKLGDLWGLLTQSPETFKGGSIWRVMKLINETLQSAGLGLVVLFFLFGLIQSCSSIAEFKRPEQAISAFVRLIIAKTVVVYGLELMQKIIAIVQTVVNSIMRTVDIGTIASATLPKEVSDAVDDLGFMEKIGPWFVSLIASLLIIAISFMLILQVYGRFFRLYMYTAISPIPLAGFAGKPTDSIGKSFIKSYAAVCLESAIVVLACVIFSQFASAPPAINSSADATTIIWSYLGETIFNMLILVGTVKASDRLVREIMGI